MSAQGYLPQKRSLAALSHAAGHCQGCGLYQRATQVVFGEGSSGARLVLVGEQPGDVEDLEGRPFVGPAGRLLDQLLEAAGITRNMVYATNVVKHFKWEPRGKRRIHKKPSSREVNSCLPWFHAEVEAVDPVGIVCLGATAAQSILGRSFRITRQRGERYPHERVEWVMATWHPAAILRAPEAATRHTMKEEFIRDLQSAAKDVR